MAGLTIRDIARMRRDDEPIAMLTAYDFTMGALLDRAGVDIILVGDSMGNVVFGHETTLPVTMADIIRHGEAVKRSTSRSLVVCDMPFGTYFDVPSALSNAARIMQQTGCHAVKLEGGRHVAPAIKALTENGIAVMAHIGLTPQSVHQLGGYYTHGKSGDEAEALLADAAAVEGAGAFAIVLECVHPSLAAELTDTLAIPTIGIGSGDAVSGQVLVINDLLGLTTQHVPRFVKPKADLAAVIGSAVSEYVAEVKAAKTSQPQPPGDTK